MSLYSYSLTFLCMEHLLFGEEGGRVISKFRGAVGYSSPSSYLGLPVCHWQPIPHVHCALIQQLLRHVMSRYLFPCSPTTLMRRQINDTTELSVCKHSTRHIVFRYHQPPSALQISIKYYRALSNGLCNNNNNNSSETKAWNSYSATTYSWVTCIVRIKEDPLKSWILSKRIRSVSKRIHWKLNIDWSTQ